MTQNPGRQHYRLYVIKRIPSLKVFDFSRITKAERDRADRLASSAAGAALESDVQGEARDSGSAAGTDAKTFVPGEGRSAEESFVTNFTPQQKELIRQMVANARSPAEIEDIERSVRRGVLPNIAVTPLPPSTAPSDQPETEGGSLKRPASPEENGNGEAAKKARVETDDSR
jgi:hypothetical protein